jgi:hypothetical protein
VATNNVLLFDARRVTDARRPVKGTFLQNDVMSMILRIARRDARRAIAAITAPTDLENYRLDDARPVNDARRRAMTTDPENYHLDDARPANDARRRAASLKTTDARRVMIIIQMNFRQDDARRWNDARLATLEAQTDMIRVARRPDDVRRFMTNALRFVHLNASIVFTVLLSYHQPMIFLGGNLKRYMNFSTKSSLLLVR